MEILKIRTIGDPVKVEEPGKILVRQAKMAERRIKIIKKEIAEDWDNINHPIPVWEMVPTASRETSGGLP